MKETLNSHKFYAVWEYKREENDLNEASKNGLQLIKGGCFHSTFRRDHSQRYIYQLDYCTKIPDMDRYIECFRDAGWEYIIFLLLSATFFLAWRSVSQTRRGERAGFVPPTQIIFPVVFLLLLIGCVMIIFL